MSRIAVIGSGVVGRATGRAFLQPRNPGHQVTFVDKEPAVLRSLWAEGLKAVAVEALPDVQADIFFLALPTPTVDGKMDLTAFHDALPYLGTKLRSVHHYCLAVVRSTVLPGTTENVIIPMLEAFSAKKAGSDFGVCTNPEFLRQRHALQDSLNPWIVVIGSLDCRAGDSLQEIYRSLVVEGIDIPIVRTDLKTAEMIKYAHNLYNATKISFTNEIWQICRNTGIDGDLVMEQVSRSAEGMWNPRYGIKGGYPFGGPCLVKDSEAFLTFARETGYDMSLLAAVIEINKRIGAG